MHVFLFPDQTLHMPLIVQAPERWLGLWEAMEGGIDAGSSRIGLQEWPEDMYLMVSEDKTRLDR